MAHSSPTEPWSMASEELNSGRGFSVPLEIEASDSEAALGDTLTRQGNFIAAYARFREAA